MTCCSTHTRFTPLKSSGPRWAPRTGEREMARGNSPVTTQLSARRVGILGADANAYVHARRRVQSARELIDSNWQRVGAAAAAVVAKVRP